MLTKLVRSTMANISVWEKARLHPGGTRDVFGGLGDEGTALGSGGLAGSAIRPGELEGPAKSDAMVPCFAMLAGCSGEVLWVLKLLCFRPELCWGRLKIRSFKPSNDKATREHRAVSHAFIHSHTDIIRYPSC